ncbi:NB-ARC domain containing protein [Trema orientale]|uniref:NB-ARC domain containing protein n=1 Tax=Trema orientale TaxID=63057 RepID=A0A2P5E0V3_TREOI|nr:NB-ARC domain containing protein [Trema orientale]
MSKKKSFLYVFLYYIAILFLIFICDHLSRHDSEFVETIVKDILKKLNRLSSISDDFKDLIGIDKSVKHIESLMFIDTHNVKIIGIWGMGGIGKTTLARVIFNRLSSQFDGCCFLTNVIERFENRGMNDFMIKLYTELLGENYQNTGNTYFKLRLRHKKVLIVLDDLNDPDQLEVLSGDLDQFGAGSRIIVTTRDAQVLRDRADESYELKGLNFGEAIELFSLNAFKRSSPTIDDMKLLVKVVNYADGIPLALKVLGSFLRSRKKENWESELNKLKKVPNKKIHNVLRLSYDGLDILEKSIFLDVVCFFKEMYCRHEVESVLGGRDSFVHIGIDNLIDKSLITVDEHNCFQMHALIQEMGWEIVRQQSIEEPGNRSRLWFAKDVYHVFKNNTVSGNRKYSNIDVFIHLIIDSDYFWF